MLHTQAECASRIKLVDAETARWITPEMLAENGMDAHRRQVNTTLAWMHTSARPASAALWKSNG